MTDYKMACPAQLTTSPYQRLILFLRKLLEMRLHVSGVRCNVKLGSYIMLAQWDFWIVCLVTTITPPADLLMHEVLLACCLMHPASGR